MTTFRDKKIVLIRRKKKKNIIHEIYLYDRTLVKRFIKTAILPDTRQVWRIEDTALRRLSGLSLPRTYGFVKKQLRGATEILYAREYLKGQPVESFSMEDMAQVARLMAQIHQRGVITRDPSPENFIRTDNGSILFIDFGRSAILNPKNPVIIGYLGKELARLRCHAFAGEDALYNRFRETYFDLFPHTRMRRFLTERISSRWYQRIAGKRLSDPS